MSSYVVASAVKAHVNGKGMMAAGDLPEHLSKVLEGWLEQGLKAAKANDRKTVRGSDILCFEPGKTSFVVASALKQHVNGKGMMASGDLPEFASGLCEWLLEEAIKRAKANDRKTVRGSDL